jgi:hypothetical protein
MTGEREIVPSPERRLSGYEPPRVERVLGPDELEREVAYAGTDLHTTVQ